MRLAIPLLALATLCAREAHAGGVSISLEKAPALTEGGRATLVVHVTNTGEKPIALASVDLALGGSRRSVSLAEEARGTSTRPQADSVVTAVLTVSERGVSERGVSDKAAGRAFGPDAFVAMHTVLAKGATTTLALEATPLTRDVSLTVRVVSIPLETFPAEAGIWAASSAPGTLALDLTKDAVAEIRAQRWTALTGEVPGAILVPGSVARAASYDVTDVALPIAVGAAAFPSSEALAKLEIAHVVSAGYSAKNELWAFDDARGSWLVGRTGKPLHHDGTLAALVLALASRETVALSGFVSPELATAFEAAGISPSSVRVSDLAPLVAALEKNACALDGLTIVKKKGAPMQKPPPEQGSRIPCIDCQVLRPGLANCAACGGKGFIFKAARMGDETARVRFGNAARKRADGAFERARDGGPWSEALSELRSALTESVLYGKAWAAGWDGRSETPADETIAAALEAKVRAELRLSVLEAEAKAR